MIPFLIGLFYGVCASQVFYGARHLMKTAQPEVVPTTEPLLRAKVCDRDGHVTAFASGHGHDALLEDVLRALTLEGRHLLSRQRARERSQ